MANSHKNIIIYPHIGNTANPKIVFSAANTTHGPFNSTIATTPDNGGKLTINTNAVHISGNTSVTNLTVTGTTNLANLVLTSILGTQYGGTGKNSFTQNGLLYAAGTTTLGFAVGTDGQVLTASANGLPAFTDLDGGNF